MDYFNYVYGVDRCVFVDCICVYIYMCVKRMEEWKKHKIARFTLIILLQEYKYKYDSDGGCCILIDGWRNTGKMRDYCVVWDVMLYIIHKASFTRYSLHHIHNLTNDVWCSGIISFFKFFLLPLLPIILPLVFLFRSENPPLLTSILNINDIKTMIE